jgi:hypothetical protein
MPQIFDDSFFGDSVDDNATDNIAQAPSLELYFSEQLREEGRHLRPPPDEDTVWYLSMMLTRFGRSESLFSFQDGQNGLRPLALLYGDALEARDDRHRCLLLQQLGDMALFLGALFPERFSQRGIRPDYVVGMGGGAYDYLADNAGKNRHVFRELANMFANLVGIIASACSSRSADSDEQILLLYQRWLQTGDAALERQLRQLGVIPAEGISLH